MTSLIFGAVYLAHQGVVHARHEKKRIKNYERWEGLRDEYDAQRVISRGSQSLDIQRTGQLWDDTDKPILTLRDQQEANDARLSWRPQEAWSNQSERITSAPTGRQSMDASYDHRAAITGSQPRTSSQPGMGRSSSLANGYNDSGNSTGPPSLQPQQTGYHGLAMRPTPTGAANWDDGLPPALAVQRRNFDDPPSSSGSGELGRSTSLRLPGSANRSRSNLGSANSSSQNLVLSSSTTHTNPPLQNPSTVVKGTSDNLNNPFETGNRFSQVAVSSNGPVDQRGASNNPFEDMSAPSDQHNSLAPIAPQITSNNPFDSNSRWSQPAQYTNGASPAFAQQVPGGRMATLVEANTPAVEKDMSEWWK